MKIPFSVYDFFGYLASGFLVLVAVDFAFRDGEWLLADSVPPVYALFWTVLAYVIGHIVAHLAAVTLENVFLRKFLGSPEVHLLRAGPRQWKAKLFPGNFQPLPKETRERVLARAKSLGGPEEARALFFHCHAIVKHEPVTLERLTIFIERYGFSRNICFASVVAAGALTLGVLRHPRSIDILLPWILLAVGVAVGMLYRYLKFFRHYTTEVFTSYAESVARNGTAKE